MSFLESGQDQVLRYHADFSESQEKQEFFLMEIDNLPTDKENENPVNPDDVTTVGFIKGELEHEAMLCTDSKTSVLISHENSNSSFVAKKIDDEIHIVCDLQDVVILKESPPVFLTALEILQKAPLGSDTVVTWHELHFHVRASENALREFLKHPSCVSRGPLEWQWMTPQERYTLSDTLLQVIVAEGFKEAVPIETAMARARPSVEKLADVTSAQAELVIRNCLQADLCDENYHVDYDKIAQFCARALLYEVKKMSLEIFKRRWLSKLPQEKELDCLKPPVYVFETEVHYIDELELSHDPTVRLKYLFTRQKKWNPDSLLAAMTPVLPGVNVNAWLMKTARFVSVGDDTFYKEKFAL